MEMIQRYSILFRLRALLLVYYSFYKAANNEHFALLKEI